MDKGSEGQVIVDSMERMERPPKNPQRISRRVLGNWEKLVAKAVLTELGRASYNRNIEQRGSYSGQSSETAPQSLAQQADIVAILKAADEIGHESVEVARILVEYAFRLSQQLDPGSEVLQFKTGLSSIMKQKQEAKHGEVDRSQDIRVIQDYYLWYRERNHIDQLEAEAEFMRKQRLSTDLVPDSEDQSFETVRRIYEISSILDDVVDALLKEAELDVSEAEDAARLQDTDVCSFQFGNI